MNLIQTKPNAQIPVGHHVAPNRKNEIGKIFSRLTVIGYAGKTSNRSIKYHCICQCGKAKVVSGESLRRGYTQSCGCLLKDKPRGKDNPNFVHGQSHSKTFYAWAGMIQRCTNPKHPKFLRYGGRGISICSRWMVFSNFLIDMGTKPQGTTLGRINNDGNYTLENCRWETNIQQANNRMNNRKLTFNGQTKTTAEWSRTLGIAHTALRMRVHRGWPTERALKPCH